MRVDLKGLHPATVKLADGTRKTYWYAWKGRGAPRLRGELGSPEFIASYNEAVATKIAAPEGRLLRLLQEYQRSQNFLGLGDKTRADYIGQIKKIEVKFGDMAVKALTRPVATELGVRDFAPASHRRRTAISLLANEQGSTTCSLFFLMRDARQGQIFWDSVNQLTLRASNAVRIASRCYLEGLIMYILHQGHMRLQFFAPRGHVIVDLNCGWYCLVAASEIKYPAMPPPPAPHGLGDWGYDVATSNQTEQRNKPTTCNGWYYLLAGYGPVIVSGKLGGADWGTHGGKKRGVGHYILINGADTLADQAEGGRLFYLDPLRGDIQKHGTFDHMNKRIDPQVHTVK